MSIFADIFKPGKFVVSDHTVVAKPKVEIPVVDSPMLVAAAAATTKQAGPTRIANVNIDNVSAMLSEKGRQSQPLPNSEITDPGHLLTDVESEPEAVIVPEMVEKEVAKSEVGKASVEQIEKVFLESPARVFFDMILEDAANLVKTGKDLEVLVADKNQLTGVEIAEGQIISDVQIANEKLTQEISRLLNNASKKDLDKEFKIVSQSFMESFDKLQELADKLKDVGRINGNKLSLQIQARKQEINKIFKAVGGPENFDKVKKWVKGVEMVQTRYAGDNGDQAFATRSSQAIYTFLNENREDLPVVTSTASSGSKFSAVDIITMMAMSSKTKLFE